MPTSRKLTIQDAKIAQGLPDKTIYGYDNFVASKDQEGYEIHNILHVYARDGALTVGMVDLSGIYNLAPCGSRLTYQHTTSLTFFKALASGNAAWVKVSTVAHGLA